MEGLTAAVRRRLELGRAPRRFRLRCEKSRVCPMASARKKRKWSADVTEHSDALDLESGVFAKTSAAEIARSLKRSAEASERRKSTPFRSAMSMLNFYINRAGRNLSPRRKRTLESAKTKLRQLFGRKV